MSAPPLFPPLLLPIFIYFLSSPTLHEMFLSTIGLHLASAYIEGVTSRIRYRGGANCWRKLKIFLLLHKLKSGAEYE